MAFRLQRKVTYLKNSLNRQIYCVLLPTPLQGKASKLQGFLFLYFYLLYSPFNICSVSTTLPSGQLSAIPWRRSGVRYNNNEAYFDVIEEVDAIIDKSGSTVFAEIQGYVSIYSKLFFQLDNKNMYLY